MATVNPQDFYLNTDYETDKIILVKEGKLTGTTRNLRIAHGLPFRPLLFGLCSFKEDFTLPKPIPYRQDMYFSGLTPSYKVSFSTYTMGDNIVINYVNEHNSSQPIYYRIYAFEPSDSHAKLAPTKKYAKIFTLDTDRDYRKLYKNGIVNMGQTVTITHNFGYIPQVMLWLDYPEFETGYIGNGFEIENPSSSPMYVDKKKLSITLASFEPGTSMHGIKIHYRIYYDET